MKICEIDREVKGVITEHSVYGCEAIMNAIARSAKHDRWLTASALHALLDAAITREDRSSINMMEVDKDECI